MSLCLEMCAAKWVQSGVCCVTVVSLRRGNDLAGNAPTMLSVSDLRKMAENWMNTSHAIFDDTQAHEVQSLHSMLIDICEKRSQCSGFSKHISSIRAWMKQI